MQIKILLNWFGIISKKYKKQSLIILNKLQIINKKNKIKNLNFK